MPRLLTAIGEAVANFDHSMAFSWIGFSHSEPLGWPHVFDFFQAHSLNDDRWQLFLGIDAELKNVNTPERIIKWFGNFKEYVADISQKKFSATVFVLDWPKYLEGFTPALPNDRDIYRIMAAGLYYRPKDPDLYQLPNQSLAESLKADLIKNQLIPKELVQDLVEAVPSRRAPDKNNPVYKEAFDFLSSKYMTWPEETINKLLGKQD